MIKVIKSKQIKLSMLVVETNAPFMTIKPAKESISSDTGYIVEKIAWLKNIDVIECGKQIYLNSIQMLTW